MTTPGVVLVSKYVTGKSKKFTSYIQYMNRDEAVRSQKFHTFNVNKLDGYNHYMSNPEKSSGLFTKHKDYLNESEKKQLQDVFLLAQKNDSVMWQDVISFDNKWLEKHGMYQSKIGWVNETAIQRSIREGMKVVLKEEGLEESSIWSAAIHYNTDNLHVHVAIVEPYPTKPYITYRDKQSGEMLRARKGNRKKSTLDKMKSKVANSLLDRDKELAKISQLIHEKIAPKEYSFTSKNQPIYMRKMYQSINEKLPSDMRLWKYNTQALSHIRPEIDSLITMFIEKYHQEDFKDLDQALIEEMEFRKEIYGDGEKEVERYQEYRLHKHQELYTKLGNALLREMKDIRLEKREAQSIQWNERNNTIQEKASTNFPNGKLSNKDLNRLKQALQKDYQSYKNKEKYKQMQREIEYEQNR